MIYAMPRNEPHVLLTAAAVPSTLWQILKWDFVLTLHIHMPPQCHALLLAPLGVCPNHMWSVARLPDPILFTHQYPSRPKPDHVAFWVVSKVGYGFSPSSDVVPPLHYKYTSPLLVLHMNLSTLSLHLSGSPLQFSILSSGLCLILYSGRVRARKVSGSGEALLN